MSDPAVFHFHVPFNVSAKVDKEAGIIRGAAVITAGITARGHALEVDEKTIDQIIECGQAKGKVQVKLNHKSGVEAICGYLSNFRKQGNKGLADWFLLKTHEEYEKILEKAEVMPDCFGLSAAFAGPKKGEKLPGGKSAARCTELLAVDCVAMPAANPDGLFEAIVDIPGTNQMPKEPASNQEPTLAEVMAAIAGLKTEVTAEFTKIREENSELRDMIEGDEPLSKEELDALNAETDEQLAERGITRAEVTAAVAALGQASATHDSPADTAAAAAPAAVTAELAAVRKQIHELSAKLEDKEEVDELETAFATLDAKIVELSDIRAKQDIQIAALQRVIRNTPATLASPSVNSERMFSANEDEHDDLTEFEKLVSKNVTELAAKEPTLTAGALKAKATRLAITQNEQAYAAHLESGGIINLGK